ncbi:protein zwilch-like, partial [Scleropages formosus]
REIQIRVVHGLNIPLQNIRMPVFVCEKVTDDTTEVSESEEQTEPLEELCTRGLTIMKARQLLSLFVISQNPAISQGVKPVLHPLWVRCDMLDSEVTIWLGAEAIHNGSKVTAVKLHSITCKGPSTAKCPFVRLDELKQLHSERHHSCMMVTRGFAKYNLFGSTVVENTVIESQSSVTVDFRWNNVKSILQTPPLSSTATLNIKVASGDIRSPLYQFYKELEFVQILADGLRTGVTEWVEPLEATSAVELTRALIEDLQDKAKTMENKAINASEMQKSRNEQSVENTMFNTLLTQRGDLDFVEQLWVKMRRSVTSYQDIVDCLQLVIKALKYGDIKPWIHRDSSSSLSKLVLQSYSAQLEPVSLTGLVPVHMLLEMGLDKMRKDYINYLISNLILLNSYYINTEVDLQEQVVRVRKLHHLLEMVVTCSTFLGLTYEHLFVLTQSCLQYYEVNPYNEDHNFQLQIRPAVISSLCQRENLLTWGVEVSSGQGSREVKTSLQLTDRSPVEHLPSDITEFPFETTVN